MIESPFFKFPTTPHIILSSSVARSDKLLGEREKEILLNNPVTIEEKIDGANLGISFGQSGDLLLQNRGQYLSPPFSGQWKMLPMWVTMHQDKLFDVLEDRYILFGEWCYAKHSIHYSRLPDWFIGFDVYDTISQTFLAVSLRDNLIEKAEIETVPKIKHGILLLDDLSGLLGKSAFGDSPCEGLYIRYDVENQLKIRAKYVRPTFVQAINRHWRNEPMQKNQVAYQTY